MLCARACDRAGNSDEVSRVRLIECFKDVGPSHPAAAPHFSSQLLHGSPNDDNHHLVVVITCALIKDDIESDTHDGVDADCGMPYVGKNVPDDKAFRTYVPSHKRTI